MRGSCLSHHQLACYPQGNSPITPDVRLWHRAVVVHQENSLRGLVRQLSIDQLDNEGRRVSIYEKTTEKSPLFRRSMSVPVRGCAGWERAALFDPGWGVGGGTFCTSTTSHTACA